MCVCVCVVVVVVVVVVVLGMGGDCVRFWSRMWCSCVGAICLFGVRL